MIFVAHIHHDCDTVPIKTFTSLLRKPGWAIATHDVNFPDFGDCISDRAKLLLGFCKSSSHNHRLIQSPTPPPRSDNNIAYFLYSLFSCPELCVSPIKTDRTFRSSGLTYFELLAKVSPCGASRSKRIYNVHHQNDSHDVKADTGIYSLDGLCPPYWPPNYDMFGSTFGIETAFYSEEFIRQFLPYEMVSCFQMTTDIGFHYGAPK